jgi:hypothetical protein
MPERRRLPRIYLPFAALTMFGPLPVMLLQHDPIHVHIVALVIEVGLIAAIAGGSAVAWTLLLLWNGLLTLAVIFASASGDSMTVGAPLFALLGISCAAMQSSPAMRAHVGLKRRRVPPAGTQPA